MNRGSFYKVLEGLGGERRINYSLDRFQQALQSLGNPEKDVQSLVIAGTNGKGTTTLFLSAALAMAGHRVCTYLSPHLQSPAERLLENLIPIDEEELAALGLELAPLAEKYQLSYFELMTLIAFVRAQRRQADFHVLEVGLGGRLDATNVTDPLACAITNISLDHQAFLGHTPAAILEEKLGVLRPESLLFTGVRDPQLLDRIEKRCLELDTVYYFSKEVRTEIADRSWGGQRVSLNGYPLELTNPTLGTAENAALAFLCLRIAFPRIPVARLAESFRLVRNPGRMEVVSERPRVVLSGDHNPAGVEGLREAFGVLPHGRVRTICAFSPDKPFQEMYAALASFSDEITLTQVPRFRDLLPPDYARLGPFEPDPLRAVETTLRRSDPEDTVLVTGSLYLVGEVRRLWRSKLEFWQDARKAPAPSRRAPGAATPAKPPPKEAGRNPAP